VIDNDEVIRRTEVYVRDELYADSSGHDWWHVHRVRRLAVDLGRKESADLYLVELAALLHDISDYKLNGGDHEKGPRVAWEWLRGLGESEQCAISVADIIANMSFKGAGTMSLMRTIEGAVVQDADWLDAVGAIGVARAFAFGGFAGQPMHDPELSPHLHASRAEYLNRDGSTINHFYEKLLLLKNRMNTATAKIVAERRHEVLEAFLREFFLEWDARDVEIADAGGAEAGLAADKLRWPAESRPRGGQSLSLWRRWPLAGSRSGSGAPWAVPLTATARRRPRRREAGRDALGDTRGELVAALWHTRGLNTSRAWVSTRLGKEAKAEMDLTGATWHRAGEAGDGESCIEVAVVAGSKEGSERVFVMRDGSKPEAGHLVFTPAEWDAFTAGVRDGEFDLPEST
jgi:uncharacterized protein